MSEDIRKMIDKVKNFKQFVNEQQIISKTELKKGDRIRFKLPNSWYIEGKIIHIADGENESIGKRFYYVKDDKGDIYQTITTNNTIEKM